MRRGDGGDEVEFGDGGGRADTERRYGFWARFLACAKPCFMACFDAFSCCASATPSPPRMRRVTTQTSVERLLPRQDLGDATSAVMAPPALMRAPSLPLPPRSPEHNPLARTCAADAELEDDVELCAKKRAAVEQPEECPLCLEDLVGNPDNPPMLLACSHRFHLPCLLALEQRSRFCPCCNALMVHPALGRD